MPTIQAALAQAASILREATIDPSEAELLLAHVLQVDRSYVIAHSGQTVDEGQYTNFINQVMERAKGKPAAYVRGQQEFYGRKFLVTPDVLVPRADSETLITESLKFLADKNTASILDIGTGSGCLIITVAAETNNRFHYVASDILAKALDVAQQNAQINHIPHIQWYQSNLLQSIPVQSFDLIIANLPYLTAEQLSEPTIQHEPVLALDGGKDGLHYYRQLLQQLPHYTTSDSVVLLEIDPQQRSQLTDEVARLGWNITFVPDLSGRDRVANITR